MTHDEQAWTQEDWLLSGATEQSDIKGRWGNVIAECKGYRQPRGDRKKQGCRVANAARIVQCINACAGIPDPSAHMAEQKQRIEELERENMHLCDARQFASARIAELETLNEAYAAELGEGSGRRTGGTQ